MAFSRTAALGYLRRAHEQKRLAHAYLISGPPGSGKREVAAELASIVNGTDPGDIFSTNAREIFLAEPESKSRRIIIEQIRELEHALQMQAANGRRKVAIISEADRLQPQAANAFLKTLEEPPRNSLLLLLSALPEALPDTILSRCISIPLTMRSGEKTPVQEREILELLGEIAVEQTWDVQTAYRIARGLHDLLGEIREEIRSQNAEALNKEELRYRNSTDGAWLDERADYYKALTESSYIQRRSELIEIVFGWWSDVLRASSGVDHRDFPRAKAETAAVAKRFTTAEVLRRIRRLEELRDHLGRNIQEALTIEAAFLEIFRS
jgi:DNA polymerase III subunit delta'